MRVISRYHYWLMEGCAPKEALERVREEGDSMEFEVAYWHWVESVLRDYVSKW